MGSKQAAHSSEGIRASALSLLNQNGLWNSKASEAELAHVGSDQVRLVYHRAPDWDERVKMTDWCAEQVLVCV